jgi:prevent-host-death family protein
MLCTMRQIGAYEAKTHLPRLLDEVEAGELITITKHGRAVAMLVPAARGNRSANAAVTALRAFRREHALGDVAIKDLIDEGRKR